MAGQSEIVLRDGRGFKMTFRNGWTLSIYIGDNVRTDGITESEDAEISIRHPNGRWLQWHDVSWDVSDTVLCVSADDIASIADLVSSINPGPMGLCSGQPKSSETLKRLQVEGDPMVDVHERTRTLIRAVRAGAESLIKRCSKPEDQSIETTLLTRVADELL